MELYKARLRPPDFSLAFLQPWLLRRSYGSVGGGPDSRREAREEHGEFPQTSAPYTRRQLRDAAPSAAAKLLLFPICVLKKTQQNEQKAGTLADFGCLEGSRQNAKKPGCKHGREEAALAGGRRDD